jgi:hypothetical protein
VTSKSPSLTFRKSIVCTLRCLVLGVACFMPAHRAQAQEDVRADIVHLKDKNPQVAFKAAQHLGVLGAEASAALGDLIQTIKTPHNVDVLEASTWAVGRIAEQACAKVDYSDAVSVTPAVAASVRNPGNRLSFRQGLCVHSRPAGGPAPKISVASQSRCANRSGCVAGRNP